MFFSAKRQAPAAGYSRVALSIMDRVEQVIKELVPLTCEDWGWNTVWSFGPRSWERTSWFLSPLSMEKTTMFLESMESLCNVAYLVVTTIALFYQASNVTSAFGFPGNLQNCDWLGKLCDLDASGFPWNGTIKKIKMYLFHRDRKGVLD